MEKYTKKEISQAQQLIAYQLSNKYNINNDIATLIVMRNIDCLNADMYFSQEGQLVDPFLMSNMIIAVDLIKKVALNNGKILIYGDYDADGISATSVLQLFFNDCGITARSILPNRDEGYGLNVEKILKEHSVNDFDLLITVDCGISNYEEINLIKQNIDIEVLVTDHHELPQQLPDCICINPKIGNYPFKDLSGSGVAWKLVWALSDLQTAKKYAFLACIGTIADVMPLIGENRSLVKIGLANANHSSINYLCKQLKITAITANDIALKISPRINSAGRIGKAELSLAVLLSCNLVDKQQIQQLLIANEERQKYLSTTLNIAQEMINKLDVSKLNFLCLYNKDFYKGVMGIAANRLADKYNIPVLLLSDDYEEVNLLGSARSARNIDIFQVFSQYKHLLIKYGGHKQSVGVTISSDCLNEFFLCVNNALNCSLLQDDNILYDLDFPTEINAGLFYSQLQIMQPIAPNEQPIFRYKGSCDSVSLFGNDRNHIKFVISNNIEIKAFNDYSKYLPIIANQGEVDILFKLEYDEYNKSVAGVVSEFGLSHSISYDKLYAKNFLLNGKIIENISHCDKINFSTSSACIVFNSYEDFLLTSRKFDFNDYIVDYFYIDNPSSKQIIICPYDLQQLKGYKQIISFVDSNLRMGYLIDSCEYFFISSNNSYLVDILITKDICASVYKVLIKQPCTLKRLILMCSTQAITYLQTLLAVRIFLSLGIVRYSDDIITTVDSAKVDLNSSNLFNFLKAN